MKQAIFSARDTRGKLYVDCSECTMGGNGSPILAGNDACAVGRRITRGLQGGCWLGDLLPDLEVK